MVSVYSLLISLFGSIYFLYKLVHSFDEQPQNNKKTNNHIPVGMKHFDNSFTAFDGSDDLSRMMFQEQNDRFMQESMQESMQQGLDSVTPWSMGGSDLVPDLAPGGFLNSGFDSFGGFGTF